MNPQLKKELIDQTAHALTAIAIFSIFARGGLIGGALAGFMVGMVRELTEEGTTVTLAAFSRAIKSWRDLFFWSIGGLIAQTLLTKGLF